MKKGFTLIELAIAVVIIGVIIVAIFKGIELVRVAHIHKVMIAVDDIKRTYTTFQMKYNCLPGDCDTAQTFLGPTIMNGNGDSEITPTISGTNYTYENFLAFEHMGSAGLYKSFSGKQDCYFNPDISNISKLFDECGYTMPSMNAPIFLFQYNDSSFFGDLPKGGEPFACINTNAGCISANTYGGIDGENTRTFDTIFDDGAPFTGRVISACTASVTNFGAYNGSQSAEPYDTNLSNCPIIVKF